MQRHKTSVGASTMRTNKWLSYEDNGAVPNVERQQRLDHHRNPSIPAVLCHQATAVSTLLGA